MYITLVCCCFLLNAVGAVYLIAQAKTESRNKVLFLMAALISIAVKMLLASRWTDYDVGSYDAVASLVLQGRSVYANTERYNYAPLWALFAAGFHQIANLLPWLGRWSFHICIAAFLAVVDVAIAALLTVKYRYEAGIFFLCSPVTVLLSGAYSQFDNFALLAGFVAWLLIREGAAPWRRVLPSAALLGLSLVIKHIFFLFPIWLLFWSRLGSLRKRVTYGAIAYALFGLSFLPWAGDPQSRAGMYEHVFHYRSRLYFSILHLFAASSQFWSVSARETSILTLIWMAVLLAAGIKLSRGRSELFPMYLLAMFAVSPAVNDYYFALPMLVCAMYFPVWPTLALTGTAMVVLFGSPGGLFSLPFNRVYYLAMLTGQISAAALFVVVQKQAGQPELVEPNPPEIARKVVTLIAASVAVMFLVLVIKAWALGQTNAAWILPTDNG